MQMLIGSSSVSSVEMSCVTSSYLYHFVFVFVSKFNFLDASNLFLMTYKRKKASNDVAI